MIDEEDDFEIFSRDDGIGIDDEASNTSTHSNNSSFSSSNRSNPATPKAKGKGKKGKGKRKAPAPDDDKEKGEGSASKKKNYQHSWEEKPAFAGWLAAVPNDPTRAACKACNSTFGCGLSEVEKHAGGLKHKANVKAIKGVPSIASQFSAQAQTASAKHKADVKSAEIHLAAFFAEHNVAISVVDHLVPVMQKAFKDSKIAKDITLGRTKCTEMIKNVVAKVETDDLVANLKEAPCYSVMIDGSTDRTSKKTMCVLVRYCSVRDGAVTQLLELVALDARDCSAQAQCNSLSKCLQIIGFGCDNENTMTGEHNSVWSRIREVAPHAVLMGCNCHSAASTAGVACAKIPPHLDEIITRVYNYIKGSGKRQANLEEFQEFFRTEKHKLLRLVKTRWLCRLALESFDEANFPPQKKKPATDILREMKNPYNEAYFLFLEYALTFFN
ncbi:hypothetical protein FOCC_FOCC015297, partial [Frankliniella occidentalis]